MTSLLSLGSLRQGDCAEARPVHLSEQSRQCALSARAVRGGAQRLRLRKEQEKRKRSEEEEEEEEAEEKL